MAARRGGARLRVHFPGEVRLDPQAPGRRHLHHPRTHVELHVRHAADRRTRAVGARTGHRGPRPDAAEARPGRVPGPLGSSGSRRVLRPHLSTARSSTTRTTAAPDLSVVTSARTPWAGAGASAAPPAAPLGPAAGDPPPSAPAARPAHAPASPAAGRGSACSPRSAPGWPSPTSLGGGWYFCPFRYTPGCCSSTVPLALRPRGGAIPRQCGVISRLHTRANGVKMRGLAQRTRQTQSQRGS